MNSKERARQRAEARTQTVWFKLKVGDNTFRILPTPASKTTQDNFYEYFLHREVGPKKLTMRCGKDPETGEGKCWLCDSYLPKLRQKGQDVRAAALVAKDTFLIQIASVDDDGKMKGPFLFNPSKTISDQILASILGSKKKTYEDPIKGYNLTISRTGTGKNDTRYGIIEADDEPSKVPASIMAVLKPFSELQEIPIYSEAKQKAAIQGVDAIEDDDEEEDDVDEEEQVEVEEDDEDEIEDVTPKKKAAAKKKAAEPEEEDEETDDEEEEEPAPVKAKPVVKSSKVVKKVVVEEEEEPVPVKKAVKKKSEPEPEEDEELELDDEDLELDDEDLEEELVPAKKVAKKK